MPDASQSPAMLRSALFVDFNNIFLGLLRIDPLAANRFAREPLRWVGWIEEGMRADKHVRAQYTQRSVLIRRCYLTIGQQSAEYCNSFIRAGFTVIPCAPLTWSDKNSADIHMAIDIMDMARRSPQINEYIVFSGDSDFAPVLVRLRALDRCISLVTNGSSAPAYRSLGNHAINAEQFITYALHPSKPHFFDVLADKLYEAAMARDVLAEGDIEAIVERVPDYGRLSGGRRYFGHSTLAAFVRILQERHQGLRVVQNGQLTISAVGRTPLSEVAPEHPLPQQTPPPSEQPHPDPAQVDTRACASASQISEQNPTPQPAPASVQAVQPEKPAGTTSELIIAALRQILASATEPLLLSEAAREIYARLGKRARNYISTKRGLGRIITQQELPDMAVKRVGGIDFLYDPARHSLPDPPPAPPGGPPAPSADMPDGHADTPAPEHSNGRVREEAGAVSEQPTALAGVSADSAIEPSSAGEMTGAPPTIESGHRALTLPEPNLAGMMQRLRQAFDLPSLSTPQWEVLYLGLEAALTQHTYGDAELPKAVQRACLDRGKPILSAQIRFVLRLLAVALDNREAGRVEYTAPELAKSFRNGVVIFCDRYAAELSAAEDVLLDRWLLGRYYPEAASRGQQMRAVGS